MQKSNETTPSFAEKVANQIRNFNASNRTREDIISVIEQDHKPLKELIEVMKDPDYSVDERQQAFAEFAPLLVTHAKAEEKALYDFLKKSSDLRVHAFEGEAEHMVADQLCEEIKRTTDLDQMSAKIKVLAEAVEHHIKEEENDILPEVKKHFSEDTLKRLTDEYVKVQMEMIGEGQDDAPPEKDLRN